MAEENKPAQLPIAAMGGSIAQAFSTGESFALAYRMAQALASSDMVPQQFKGNPSNCMVALDIANRTGASPFMVMQNLNVIHGRPSWASQFIIAALNSCGRFTPLRFKFEGEGDKRQCSAQTTDKATGETLQGPACSIAMAKAEGWHDRNGSKWKTMPELMLTYRAAAFFGRLYAPDVLMGMHTAEEIADVEPIDVTPGAPAAAPTAPAGAGTVDDLNAKAAAAAAAKRGKKKAGAETPSADPTPPAQPAAPAAGSPTPPQPAAGETQQQPAERAPRRVVTEAGQLMFETKGDPDLGHEFQFPAEQPDAPRYRVVEVTDVLVVCKALAPQAAPATNPGSGSSAAPETPPKESTETGMQQAQPAQAGGKHLF